MDIDRLDRELDAVKILQIVEILIKYCKKHKVFSGFSAIICNIIFDRLLFVLRHEWIKKAI